MTNINTLGIDLAKNIFQLHGIDSKGNTVLKKRIKRDKFAEYIANLPPCLIGMEACGGAHFWANKFVEMGHTVKIMAPQFVKPYVKSNKNDARDAEAICEAVGRPNMRFVPIKKPEHQDMQMLHRIRSQAVKQRTALSNQLRGFLAEYGVVIAKGINAVRKNLWLIIEDAENALTYKSRELFAELYDEFKKLDERVKHYDKEIADIAKSNPTCKRLMEVEGVGPKTATAMWCTVTQPELFKNGRCVAAFLGLVPKQHSSGGKTILLGISKRGDRYLRTLLIHGARNLVRYSERRSTPRQRWIHNKSVRSHKNKTAVAVANKNVRILWALMRREEVYRPMVDENSACLPQGTQA